MTEGSASCHPLPEEVVVALLQREYVLMLAEMHLLSLKAAVAEEGIKVWKRNLKQVSATHNIILYCCHSSASCSALMSTPVQWLYEVCAGPCFLRLWQ